MSEKESKNHEPIAIIGMACIFPQAQDLRQFWRNILEGVDAISEPQPEWEAERYLSSNRIKTSSGGYLKELYEFDPSSFGIIPNSIDGGEPDQFIALRVAYQALRDAGYARDDYDHRETGIILGHSTYLHRGQGNLIQHNLVLDQTLEILKATLPSLSSDKLNQIRHLLKKRLPQFNADIVPGLVPNVMTGRIANRLNFKGPNYLIDAACSSSLLAVGAAMDELRNNRSRIMLAGGVNASLPAEVSVIFTQLGALSERGKVRPFDANSDGTLLGEGLGVVVLKRLSDARADGDRVYAIIHEIGQASDGRGHGLLAPSVEGEFLAINRAYATSNIDPATVELIEAHGTGIPLGDKTEISALKRVFGDRGSADQGTIAIGSVKSMISHCIPAAGIAGLIKSTLALHHKIIPPTLCDKVNPELELESTPFYVNNASRPWISKPESRRRAGINSFGFGGINTHAIIEETPQDYQQPLKLLSWPAELCIFSGLDVEDLKSKLQNVLRIIKEKSDLALSDLAASLILADTDEDYRIAIVAENIDDLVKKIGQALKRFDKKSVPRWSVRTGIFFSSSPIEGKLAFMFPGEGSQYLRMFEDLSLCFEEIIDWFDFWRTLYPDESDSNRTDILFPQERKLSDSRREKLEKRLHDMDVGSEAVFIASQAMHSLLLSLQVTPDAMVGHSTGESSALVASGAIAPKKRSQLADFIRELNSVYKRVSAHGKIPTGVLLAVGALPRDTLEKELKAYSNKVVIAMDNCPNQIVLFGDKENVKSLEQTLTDLGGICAKLPFDRGYHTESFSAVSEAFHEYYASIGLKSPKLPLYSCATAKRFPKNAKGVTELASSQWSTKVQFRETIEQMYKDGFRYFIEVGPSGNLSSFVDDILTKKEILTIPTNLNKQNGVGQFLNVLAQLYINRKPVGLKKLFESRHYSEVSLTGDLVKVDKGVLLDNTMPTLSITKNDRDELQKIVSSATTRQKSDYDSAKTEQTVQNSSESVQMSEDVKSEEVMTGYFDLMKSFLNHQSSLLQNVDFPDVADPKRIQPEEDFTPFLDNIIERNESYVEAQCHLSVFADNFLRDHILSGTVSEESEDLMGLSCVPLMVSLEIMAEACCLLANKTTVTAIENVSALDWIGLDEEEMTLHVQAESLPARKDVFRAKLLNEGKVVVAANFCFADEKRLGSLPELSDKKEFRWPDQEMYDVGMFHGPVFQSIRNVEAWDQQGIDAELSEVSLKDFFAPNAGANLVLNPVLLDAFGQLAAYWIAQQIGTDFNCFPSTIERIELYENCPADMQGLVLKARQRSLDPRADPIKGTLAWNFECLGSDGMPLVRAINLVNVFFSVPNHFYQFRHDPLNNLLGVLNSGIINDGKLLWELPHFSENFCSQSSGIFMRILAFILLGHEEREQWNELTENLDYKRQWLLGRACIKEAVRHWIYQRTGVMLYAADVVVRHDEVDYPYVDGWWTETVFHAPEVSLSHNNSKSLVAVSEPDEIIRTDV